jgi:D-mannonate dehydratase
MGDETRCGARLFNEQLTGYRSCVRPKGHRGQHRITQRLDECTPISDAASVTFPSLGVLHPHDPARSRTGDLRIKSTVARSSALGKCGHASDALGAPLAPASVVFGPLVGARPVTWRSLRGGAL